MIQETAAAAVGAGFAPPVVVCNEEHRFLVAEQMRAPGSTARASCWSRSGATARRRSPRRRCWWRRPSRTRCCGCWRPTTPSPTGRAAGGARPSRSRPRGRAHRDLRHASDGAGDRLRLHRASARRWRAGRRATTWRASSRSRTRRPRAGWSAAAGICGTPACSCSPRRPCWRRSSCMRPRCWPRCAPRCRPPRRPRFHPAGPGGVRAPARHQHRLRGGRAHPGGRRGAGRHRLVRRRQLGRAVGARRQGCRRQRQRRRRAAGGIDELLRPQRRHRDRRGRASRMRSSWSPRTRCWRCTATGRRT